MKKFGEKVKYYRTLANLTQEQLAEKCGCSAQTISGTETGYSFPCSKVLFAIAFSLNVPLVYLFNFDDDKKITDNETALLILDSVQKMSNEQRKIALKIIQAILE